MKKRIISVLIVLAVLTSGLTACNPRGGYLIQVMKIVPEDTIMISCMDVDALAEDPDFTFMYEASYGLINWSSGINASDVSACAAVRTVEDDFVYVFIGDFNLADVRDALLEDDWIEGEYEGLEIWQDNFEFATAFIDDMIITGYKEVVEACICIHKDEEPSMYDNEDTRAVADKLPIMPYRMVLGADYYMVEFGEDYDMSEFEYLAYSFGINNENRDDELLDISVWSKFDTEALAEAAIENIEDISSSLFMGTTMTFIDANQSGQFVEITGEIEIP